MIRGNGFLQMFSIPPVGGVGGHLDFHLDTHNLMSKTDYGKQQEAQEESKRHGGPAVYIDQKCDIHIYDNGSEMASNDRTPQYNDNGSWQG